SAAQINVSWSASTDNVGVAGYTVFRNGAQIAIVSIGTAYSDTGLAAGVTYSYTVSAFDYAGNQSAVSTAASATTVGGVGCTSAGSTWANSTFTNQTGSFTIAFDVTSASAASNSTIGLAPAAPTGFTSLAAIVGLSSTGIINARNGATYMADNVIP